MLSNRNYTPTGRPRGRPKSVPNYHTTINLEAYQNLVEEKRLKDKLPTRCPRCAGPMIPGYNDATCLYCGEYVCSDREIVASGAMWPPQGERWDKK